MQFPRVELSGPYWPEPIQVSSEDSVAGDARHLVGAGAVTDRHFETILPLAAVARAQVSEWRPDLAADATHFRLAIEAERLRLAYSCDPLLATNNANIDLLPHQLEAVYDCMLPQPVIRHLMAHDAGAGKTIMGGLLHKELRMRQPELRTLIVAPAALVGQWQRELREKFFEPFTIVDRKALHDDAEVWTKTQQAITSVAFASQYEIRATLAAVPWDLVIVDEAHHMAGYEERSTQAYELGRILARRTKHLVLATATPHKGDPVNFLRLLQLLDPDISDPAVVRDDEGSMRGTPLMLRRLKEEMVDFEGQPLFLPREVVTHWYLLSDYPGEYELYSALTDYVSKTYRAAEKVGGQTKVNVQFAMAILQRRMASSLASLERSLVRRRQALLQNVDTLMQMVPGYAEDAPEDERWESEERAETASPAKSRKERQREADEITKLLEHIDQVRALGPEAKVIKLQQVMAEADVAPGNGERLLVFTEFLDTLKFLRALFEEWGYSVTQIDGSMPQPDRLRAEREFRESCQVMVATEAAGEGINLQFCARMVNFDLPWVPTRLEQRMGRIHRYGQKRVARIYNLGAGDTREGSVLKGLLARLDTMRDHLGDQVFDVISELIADADMQQLMTRVAVAPPEVSSQHDALEQLLKATLQGEERYRQHEPGKHPLDPSVYSDLQQASRQFRLTPEYGQHFLVDMLQALGDEPTAWPRATDDAGDAPAFAVTAYHRDTSLCLGIPREERIRLTFDRETALSAPAQLLALGSQTLDRALAFSRDRWGPLLQQGAQFCDPRLGPGGGYLIWHLKARVVDGLGQTVAEQLFAVRQNQDNLEPVATSVLIDLIPAEKTELSPSLHAASHEPIAAWQWSLEQQQLPWLAQETEQRRMVVDRRRDTLVTEAQSAVEQAQRAYDEAVWQLGVDTDAAERRVREAEARLAKLEDRLEHESACSLAWPEVVSVAAVRPLQDIPEEEMPDLRPEVAAAAMAAALVYERAHAREPMDVSGEHQTYPYDILSTGPGGPRYIEVKGTTTGHILLSENEHRAAKRFGSSYYLYVVSDPLGEARLAIIHDPHSRMAYDAIIYSGATYRYNHNTWAAAVDEGSS